MFMVQADRLGPKVGGHLAPCCAHRVDQGELSQCCFQHDDSTINIVLVLLLLLLLLSVVMYRYVCVGDSQLQLSSAGCVRSFLHSR